MKNSTTHPFSGQKVYLGTKHEKASALSPLFSKIGMELVTVDIDTDQFGTFSGEVERTGSIEDTLRIKSKAILKGCPEARFTLASEGTFGPHPYLGFIRTDHEALLFCDHQKGVELLAEYLSTETNHDEIELTNGPVPPAFLQNAKFPSHALIVTTTDKKSVVIKGIANTEDLDKALVQAFQRSPDTKILVSTDMRASFNPTRMKVIAQAGEKLLGLLTSECPSCHSPGFRVVRFIRGLPCADCGLASQLTKQIVKSCPYCGYEQDLPREDGLQFADSGQCEYCNP